MVNMCRLGIDRTNLYNGLDPLTAISARPEFYEFKINKESGQNGGYKSECTEGYVRIRDVCTNAEVSENAVRNYAKRVGIEIIKGLLSNEASAAIIAHYANYKR